jgi:hypothetical protein
MKETVFRIVILPDFKVSDEQFDARLTPSSPDFFFDPEDEGDMFLQDIRMPLI